MKVFVVSLALLLLFVSMFAFSSDMETYVRLQERLKQLAEDCACGCALCLDRYAFAEGVISFDEKGAGEYMECMTEEGAGSLGAKNCRIDWTLEWDGASCTAALTASFDDVFRLPYLTATSASRSSTYEWK